MRASMPFGAVGLVMLLAAACAAPVEEVALAPAREAMEVRAPVDVTWDIAAAVMRNAGAQVALQNRETGLITLETMEGGPALSAFADCGESGGTRNTPDAADVQLRVLGDSTRSSVQVIVRWQHYAPGSRRWQDCLTTGEFEQATETLIRQRSEIAARRPRQD